MRLRRRDKAPGNLTRAEQLGTDQSPAEGVLWGLPATGVLVDLDLYRVKLAATTVAEYAYTGAGWELK
jgi:hypothetical protein